MIKREIVNRIVNNNKPRLMRLYPEKKDDIEDKLKLLEKYLYKNVPKYGLATSFKKGKVLDIARILLKISQRGLKNRKFLSLSGYDERKYLENIEINLEKNLSPADMLIHKYYHQWGKSIKPIYEENIF